MSDSLKRELERQRKARHQLEVVNEIAGLWEDARTTDEIIADIEGARTDCGNGIVARLFVGNWEHQALREV